MKYVINRGPFDATVDEARESGQRLGQWFVNNLLTDTLVEGREDTPRLFYCEDCDFPTVVLDFVTILE